MRISSGCRKGSSAENTGAMYRTLLWLLACIAATSSAPQDNSDITYVEIKPTLADAPLEPKTLEEEAKIEKLPLIFGGNFSESEKEIEVITEKSVSGSETTTPLYEVVQTENYDSESTTISLKPRKFKPKSTKLPSPRYYSKLSYFQKANDVGPASTNLVERPGRRMFKSKCRCERISNCPKLQISVPRCPEEYFMCCF